MRVMSQSPLNKVGVTAMERLDFHLDNMMKLQSLIAEEEKKIINCIREIPPTKADDVFLKLH